MQAQLLKYQETARAAHKAQVEGEKEVKVITEKAVTRQQELSDWTDQLELRDKTLIEKEAELTQLSQQVEAEQSQLTQGLLELEQKKDELLELTSQHEKYVYISIYLP